MSFCQQNYVSCPNIQAHIKNAFMKINPALFATIAETGFVQWLRSSYNTDGFLQNLSCDINGKIRTVQTIWSPRISVADVSQSCVINCSPTNKLGDRYENYAWDGDCVSYSFSVTPAELQYRCEANEDWFNEKILQAMSGIIRKLEVDCAGKLTGLIGSFAADEAITDDIKQVCVEYSSESIAANMPSYRYIQEIEFSAGDMGYPTPPVVLGWSTIWKAFSAHKAACCAYNGINISEWVAKNGISIIPSKAIDAELDGNFITTAAGAMQLVFFPEFLGAKGISIYEDDSYKANVIFDPMFNIPFDYHQHTTCVEGVGDVIAVTLKVAYMLVGYPNDLFCTGDELRGVTFVNEWCPCGDCGSLCYGKSCGQ